MISSAAPPTRQGCRMDSLAIPSAIRFNTILLATFVERDYLIRG